MSDATPNLTGEQADAAYRQIIDDLITTGAKLLNALPEAADLSPAQRIEAFDRGARAIRRCVILARHIVEHPLRPGRDDQANAAANPPRDPDAAARRALARKQIIRTIDDEITRDGSDAHDADTLRAELCERLDAPDLDDDIIHRPIKEIIAEIRRDLGLANFRGVPPWPRRTPESLRILAALAAAPTGAAVNFVLVDEPAPRTDPRTPSRAAAYARDG